MGKTQTTKHSKHEQQRAIAVIAYITLVGLLIALILNQSKKDPFASFHIRQGLLVGICAIILGFIPILGFIIALVYVILGIVSAIQGEQKELPVIGSFAQDWFKGL
jgi:uncharacterized membrane protein